MNKTDLKKQFKQYIHGKVKEWNDAVDNGVWEGKGNNKHQVFKHYQNPRARLDYKKARKLIENEARSHGPDYQKKKAEFDKMNSLPRKPPNREDWEEGVEYGFDLKRWRVNPKTGVKELVDYTPRPPKPVYYSALEYYEHVILKQPKRKKKKKIEQVIEEIVEEVPIND